MLFTKRKQTDLRLTLESFSTLLMMQSELLKQLSESQSNVNDLFNAKIEILECELEMLKSRIKNVDNT